MSASSGSGSESEIEPRESLCGQRVGGSGFGVLALSVWLVPLSPAPAALADAFDAEWLGGHIGVEARTHRGDGEDGEEIKLEGAECFSWSAFGGKATVIRLTPSGDFTN